MTRLKNILLAGTIVPALVLPPISAGWAQAPGAAEHGGPGGAAGGPGARGAGAEPPRSGAGRPERAAPSPRAEHAEPAGGGNRAEHLPAAGPRAGKTGEAAGGSPAAGSHAGKAAEAVGGGAAPSNAGARDLKERHGAQAPATADRAAAPSKAVSPPEHAAERPASVKATTPTDRAAERSTPAPADRATPAERAERRGAPSKTTTAAPAAAAKGVTPAERAAAPAAAGKATPTERAGAPAGVPGTAAGREPGTSPNGRGPAAAAAAPGTSGQPGRYNDPSSPQGGGFRNGQNNGGQYNNGQNNNGRNNGGQFNNGQNNNGRYNNGQTNGGYDNRRGDERRGGISPGGAAAIGAAAGFAGGFLAATAARDLEGVRRDRRETVEDGRTYIREPGRTIVDEGGGRAFIVHDENDRFRELGYDVRRERRGSDFVDVINRPGGEQILTYTTTDGRMLRRIRRTRDGREIVLINNAYGGGGLRPYTEDVVDLPPPRFDIPRERYAVDYGRADEGQIYDTLIAPPVAPPPRRYTLDQIRYSPDVRRYVRSVDINTINFDSGSWVVPGSATGKLQALGQAIKRAVAQNPNSVFLIEGYTDATGNPNDNLSLSDRRAQSVAAILSKDFGVPPENLTTQGYGQQNPKVDTPGPSAENRRVVVQNITQLMADNGGNAPPPPR